MKMRTFFLATPILLMASASFAADDYPELKPGLWSTQQTFTDGKIPPQGGKMCTNNDVFKAYQHLSKDPNRPCKAISQTHTGSTYTSTTECNFSGRVVHSTSIMTATGDSAIHLEMKSDGGGGIVMDMKYLGACPADMVPGDFITNSGMRMNVLPGKDSPTTSH